MEAVRNLTSNSSSSPIQRVLPVLLFFLGLIGLYYIYQYLFGPTTGTSYVLIDKTQPANPAKPLTPVSKEFPVLYEGGEFSISTWIYVNNWNVNNGKAKRIINITHGDFDTFRLFLGATVPSLGVRFTTGTAPSSPSATNDRYLKVDVYDTLSQISTSPQIDNANQLVSQPICDLPEIDLQRWVNVTVSVNNKTVDVYIDGKLSRSCVLPDTFKSNPSYEIKLLDNGGFGGNISTTIMYDKALNPEQVYQNYMTGPEPITNLKDLFLSMFAPGVNISVTTN